MNNSSTEKFTWPQWKAFFGTFAGWTLDAMDWMFVALALPLIMKEWNLGLPTAGLLGGATLIGVGISSFLSEPFADRFGRVKGLTLAICGYAVLTDFAVLPRMSFSSSFSESCVESSSEANGPSG